MGFWWKSQWRKAAGRESWRERERDNFFHDDLYLFVCEFGGEQKTEN